MNARQEALRVLRLESPEQKAADARDLEPEAIDDRAAHSRPGASPACPPYYVDWLRVAREEALHFTLLREPLRTLGHDYGDFDAHDGLWAMAEQTRCDVVARMALVPRTLEARGLDATPPLQAKLRKAGDLRAV